MVKNYYTILGIPRTADKARIKRAYRRVAKQVHPDKCGSEEGRRQFQEAQQAYETLADDAGRRKYDRKLRDQEKNHTGEAVPVRVNRSAARRGPASGGFRRRSPVEDAPKRKFYSGSREFDSAGLRAELHLSFEEARDGTEVPFRLPRARPCPFCSRSFFSELFFCPVCDGSGYIETSRRVTLQVPPGVRHGETFQVRLPEDAPFSGPPETMTVTIVIDPD